MNVANDFRARMIIRTYKFGNWVFYKTKNRILKRLLSVVYKFLDKTIQLIFGTEVPAKTRIGANVVLAHGGQGIIISPSSVIKDNVIIYHQVTIGGLGLGHLVGDGYMNKNKSGAPVIGNNVFIGTGAKILGPVKVGDGAKIGANAVVTKDVPANSTAVGIPAKILNINS